MRILLDTNIVTRLAQANHPQHSIAVSALVALTERGESLCVVPQVFYEFWVVATRPVDRENGLGPSGPEAQSHLEDFSQAFSMLDDHTEAALRNEWNKLILEHDVKGKAAHDARLVAAMKLYGVTTILTFNKPHFARYNAIMIMSPEESTQARP